MTLAIIRRGALGAAAVVLLVACSGDDEPDADQGAATDLEIDPEDLEELREQLEELGQAAEEFELEPVEQDPDRPLLMPADVTVTGDLEGTYTENPGCDVLAQYVDPDDGYHEDVLEVRFGWAGHTFDWTTGPDDPREVVASLYVPGFTSSGTYDGIVSLGRVELVATGSAQVAIEELRREEFPTGEIVIIEGTFNGSWEGSAGSGEIAGDIGVCNVRAP